MLARLLQDFSSLLHVVPQVASEKREEPGEVLAHAARAARCTSDHSLSTKFGQAWGNDGKRRYKMVSRCFKYIKVRTCIGYPWVLFVLNRANGLKLGPRRQKNSYTMVHLSGSPL